SGRFVLGAMGKYRSPQNWINTPRGSGANLQAVHEAPISFWGYPAVNASLSLVVGVVPFVLSGLVSAAATTAIGTQHNVELALWHGINPPLMLSLIVIIIGAIAFWNLPRLESFLVPRQLSFSVLDAVAELCQATTDD